MEKIKRRDPEPIISRLEVLVESIKDGKIKLPNFQRPYVWQKPDIINLLDSIYRGYPIGSILLWATTEKLESERSILEALDIVDDNNSFQTEYLLDGQQRLTTICGVLYWKEQNNSSKWNVCFNLDTEEFEYTDKRDSPNYFPLNKLIETRSFLKECLKFERHEMADIYYNRAEALLKSIKDYKIAVVKIGDMKLEEVAPVFERINSKGRVLTMLDLMRAATWKDGFDLSAEIKKITRRIKEEGFGDLHSDIVLKSISVSSGGGYNKADIDALRNLSGDELHKAASSASESLLEALLFLRKIANISDESLIPYYQQIVLVAEIYRVKRKFTSADEEEIRSWFWITSISKYFSGANTGTNKKNLISVREYANDMRETIFDFNELDLSELLNEKFNLRNALSTSMATLLSSKIYNVDILGHSINKDDISKSKDYFKTFVSTSKYAGLTGSHFFCLGKKDIQLDTFENLDDTALANNFLNKKCVEYLLNDSLQDFYTERSKILKEYIESLVSVRVRLDFENE